MKLFTRPWRLASGLTLALALAGAPALANGRYPRAQQLLVDPADGAHLFLRSTYGVLTTADSGGTWTWICEAGIGYDPGEDPMMAILGDGSVLAGASTGLYVTHDRGCSWPSDTTIGSRFVRDLAAENDGVHALAITITVEADGTYATEIFRSPDHGATWAPLGGKIAPSALPFTIDEAPSDARRLYVTAATLSAGDAGGAMSAPGTLYRSGDGGATWQSRPIPGTSRDDAPFIAAVHPTNPDELFVRVQGQYNGNDPVQSWLLYSSDAGDTWKEIFRASADMLGFAVMPGGTGVLVGMGDTREVLRPVDTTVLGLYRGAAPDFSFSRMNTNQIGCLTYTESTLYVCSAEQNGGYELGMSMDDGTTTTGLFHYGTVKGPLECGADTPQAKVCAPGWPYACAGLGSCPMVDAGPVPASGDGASSGCCGGASGSSRPQTGTARLDIFPGAEEGWLAAAALAASILRRVVRRRSTPG